jgi:multidrug efflux pump subunit AcrA (membrane-fusion protein)
MARLTAPGATIIRAIPVHEGQKIAAGTLVARLDDRIAAAGVAQAQATARMAGKRAEQQEQLLGVGGIARNTLDDTRQQLAVARTAMAAAQAVLSLTRLASPLSGTVAKICAAGSGGRCQHANRRCGERQPPFAHAQCSGG